MYKMSSAKLDVENKNSIQEFINFVNDLPLMVSKNNMEHIDYLYSNICEEYNLKKRFIFVNNNHKLMISEYEITADEYDEIKRLAVKFDSYKAELETFTSIEDFLHSLVVISGDLKKVGRE